MSVWKTKNESPFISYIHFWWIINMNDDDREKSHAKKWLLLLMRFFLGIFYHKLQILENSLYISSYLIIQWMAVLIINNCHGHRLAYRKYIIFYYFL